MEKEKIYFLHASEDLSTIRPELELGDPSSTNPFLQNRSQELPLEQGVHPIPAVSVFPLLPALSSTFIAYTSATFLRAGQRIQCLYCMGTVFLCTCVTGLVTLLLL